MNENTVGNSTTENDTNKSSKSLVDIKSNPRYRGLRPFSKDNQPAKRGRNPGSKSIKAALDRFGDFTTPEKFLEKIRELFPRVKKLDLFNAAILRVYIEAIQGESWAIEFIADRLEGKPVQTTIMGLNDETIIPYLDNISNILSARDDGDIFSDKEEINNADDIAADGTSQTPQSDADSEAV